uniref:Lysosome-associated membrane glycoprotein 2-like luminal domain-containing protein n=1 Tax=Callorhinchus milii TaxID=7868 RepID=A0A4W3GTR1_CALMI
HTTPTPTNHTIPKPTPTNHTTPTPTNHTTPNPTPTNHTTPTPTNHTTSKPTPTNHTTPTPTNHTTSKPTPTNHTTPTAHTTTTAHVTVIPSPTPHTDPEPGKYNVTQGNKICLKVFSSIQIRVRYNTTHKQEWGIFYIHPNKVKPSGTCGEVNATLNLKFPEGHLSFVFKRVSLPLRGSTGAQNSAGLSGSKVCGFEPHTPLSPSTTQPIAPSPVP